MGYRTGVFLIISGVVAFGFSDFHKSIYLLFLKAKPPKSKLDCRTGHSSQYITSCW